VAPEMGVAVSVMNVSVKTLGALSWLSCGEAEESRKGYGRRIGRSFDRTPPPFCNDIRWLITPELICTMIRLSHRLAHGFGSFPVD
jgi:hypothetical protein